MNTTFQKLSLAILIFSSVLFFSYRKKDRIRSWFIAYKMNSFRFVDENLNSFLLYRLYTPPVKGKLPLVISLHGAGGRGDDNKSQLNDIVSFFTSSKLQKKYPCFVFAPQCPVGKKWLNTVTSYPFDHYNQSEIPESKQMKMVIKVIHQLIEKYPVDTNKIYIMGFSMGASGTWDIITRYPDLFTAAALFSGVSDTTTAVKVTHIPIWAFHGDRDNIAPVRLNQEMQAAINNLGGNCKLTIFKNTGHDCSGKAVHYPGFVDWLFDQHK